MKKYKNIIITVVAMVIVLGFYIPFFFHEDSYMTTERFIIIDIDNEFEKTFKGHSNNSADSLALRHCVDRDFRKSNFALNPLENLLLRRITIIQKAEEDKYILEFRTAFNIKYRKNETTERIDTLKINKTTCR